MSNKINIAQIIGNRIKSKRTEFNLTQAELAEKIGVKRAAVNKYETGQVENLKRDTIKKLSDLFGISPYWLMAFDVDDYSNINISTNIYDLFLECEFQEAYCNGCNICPNMVQINNSNKVNNIHIINSLPVIYSPGCFSSDTTMSIDRLIKCNFILNPTVNNQLYKTDTLVFFRYCLIPHINTVSIFIQDNKIISGYLIAYDDNYFTLLNINGSHKTSIISRLNSYVIAYSIATINTI